LLAFLPKASELNEHTSTAIKNQYGEVFFKQIAGTFARRIVCYSQEGKQVKKAEQSASLSGTSEVKNGTRSCRYVCAMVLYFGKDRFYCVQETMEGSLIEDISEERGKGGFGYDPIVFLSEYGKTVAELSDEEKNAISHRGKAGRSMRRIIEMLR